MRTSKNFGAIFLIGYLPTTRPLSQKKQFLASWKVTNHQGAGSIARRSQWWKMRQACQSVWKICKNDLDVVIFWNYCTALRVYNLYTWYFSRLKALNSFQCWVEVVKFWHFKEPFSCLHRPWRFFFHKNPGTSMRSIYSHPFQSWLKRCFVLLSVVFTGDVGIFWHLHMQTYPSDFGGISVASPSKTSCFSRFLRLPRSLLSANPGETGDQRQGSGEPCRATVQPQWDMSPDKPVSASSSPTSWSKYVKMMIASEYVRMRIWVVIISQQLHVFSTIISFFFNDEVPDIKKSKGEAVFFDSWPCFFWRPRGLKPRISCCHSNHTGCNTDSLNPFGLNSKKPEAGWLNKA